ncbi:DUF456 domain-containing protein [Caldithrix abyssi]|uniref:DUF456 domain-containing protein n=1 Tax=Caldithrix abyssi DSM 13497 TaxID=880073 RepID=H1XSU2_CALAY|nr:DUF456 domain-containing protein [Caldithrix abyssi]APF20268.1 Protein of unknown function (DUF456) [Caldithrix abyssi DSM 13497]EHO40319.1 protein of unknown function DUF456 [Caldithrix abyssi DSM 13497]
MTTILEIALISIVTASTIANFFGIPGNVLIALGSLFYAVSTGFSEFSFGFVLTIFAVMILFEALEFILISISARHYGSSRWGVAGAIIGGIAGAISGAFFTPVLGGVIGSFLGVFAGTFIVEFIRSAKIQNSLKAAYGAFLGRIGGLSVKVIGAVTLGIMIVTHL